MSEMQKGNESRNEGEKSSSPEKKEKQVAPEPTGKIRKSLGHPALECAFLARGSRHKSFPACPSSLRKLNKLCDCTN